MNSIYIKNILNNQHHIYYGKKSIHQYTTELLEIENVVGYIIEKKNDDLIHVFKKIIHKGYLYNSTSINLLYIIEKINIVVDEKHEKHEKNQIKKIVVPQKSDALIQELKETLSKRLKNKLD